MIPSYNKPGNNDGFEKILFIVFITMLFFGIAVKCSAQKTQQKAVYDTVMCDQACIQKYVQIPNEKIGIKLRNGAIQTIIRIKTIITVRR